MNDTIGLIKELNTIIVALISGISLLLVAYLNKYHERKLREKEWERDQAKKEAIKAKIELSALTLFFSYDLYEYIDEQVSDIFNTTKASRFLIMFAINGKDDFKTVTVAYEHTKDTKSEGAIRRYIRVPIDSYYKTILKETEKLGAIDVITKDLPSNSLLYNIYMSREEQVTSTRKEFIKRLHIDEENDLILYASIGTHEEELFTLAEKYKIDLAINNIKSKTDSIKIQ